MPSDLSSPHPIYLQFLNDQGANSGDGFYCILDSDLERAKTMAGSDPLHKAGVRAAHLSLWLVKKFDSSEVRIFHTL